MFGHKSIQNKQSHFSKVYCHINLNMNMNITNEDGITRITLSVTFALTYGR